ncbi:MAG: 30S ribosomal protein S7 [Balneolales bacterium]
MRRRSAEKRFITPDPDFSDRTVSRFINCLMKDGKKTTARKILKQAFSVIEEKTGKVGIDVFKEALNNTTPVIEVKSRRVGGSTYQVPVEVRPERSTALSMRWLIRSAAARNDKSMSARLAREIMDAANNEGGAVRKKDETHRMAEANKAFAHFRF